MFIMKYALLSLLISSLLIASCDESNTNSSIEDTTVDIETLDSIDYLQEGQLLATKTQLVLGEHLMKAIKSGGTENAILFCSNKAIQLTDSMSISLNARLKRVSDKNRNPKNNANERELAYINRSKEEIAKGKFPKPQLIEDGNKRIGYYPIYTDQRCMQCHGQPKSAISPSTLSKINDLYPNDRATGYQTDQLRGIWVVEMDNINSK